MLKTRKKTQQNQPKNRTFLNSWKVDI